MMRTPADRESGLVARARAGDADAFASLIAPHRDGLFAFLARAAGDTDLAEDLFQMTMIRAWQGLANYVHRGRLAAWLFTIARRALIDERRRRTPPSAQESGHDPVEKHDPLARLVAAELEAALAQKLRDMSEPRRTVFLMRHHSTLTFREIAEALEMPLGTALSHMHHAVRSLKTVLEAHDVAID